MPSIPRDEVDRALGDQMRKWSELKGARKKTKRVLHLVRDFFRYHVIGGYQMGGLLGLYHFIRCHVWNRYHIVNLKRHRSTSEEYRWGWIDRDHAILLACFTILCDYVEKEDPTVGWEDVDDYKVKDRDWMEGEKEGAERQVAAGREIRALYAWWIFGRQLEHKEALAAYERQDVDWVEKQTALEERDEEMLGRLMKVRGYLWT